MLKVKTIYLCKNCAFESPKWLGKCPSCNEWNSFTEENQIAKSKNSLSHGKKIISSKAQALHEISHTEQRLNTPFPDLNAVLGGGFKSGSLVLLSGEPGIGKSTLTLQLCDAFAKNTDVLYVSGEESTEQISSRAKRLQIESQKIRLLNENNLESIVSQIELLQPGFVIIDSIQVLSSMEIPSISGSINQVRYCTETLMDISKKQGISMLIIGHITKDGDLAGPKFLEHLVDTVLFIEGDRYQQFRIIRSLKNRFGSTSEISIMEMGNNGLKEVTNPSEQFLHDRKDNSSGSAITVSMEGSKPMLLEVQALSNHTVFGYPKRSAAGYDLNRSQLLAAVINKHTKVNLNSQDLFINIAGGMKIKDTFSDLAVAMAIISSYKKIPLPKNSVFIGEIGLSGELRQVSQIDRRISEAKKMGFTQVICPKQAQKDKACTAISSLEEAINLFFK